MKPHHGQARIASAIGPSQRWQRKRSSSAAPERRRKLSAWSASGESTGFSRRRRRLSRPRLLDLREGALERLVEGDRVRIPVPRIEGSGLAQHGAERRRHAREEAPVARGRPLEGPRRQPPRQELVGDDAEGEHVGGEPRAPVGLLRRHVAEGARVGDRDGRARREARDAEVRERGVPVREDQHVLGLHVAVQDALGVRMGESRGDVAHHAQRQLARAAGAGVVGEAALGQVGGEHEVAVDPVRVPHRHDVGVREARGDARLVRDGVAAPLGHLRGLDDLERDRAVLHRVPRAPDRGEGALAERPLQPVLPEPRAAPKPESEPSRPDSNELFPSRAMLAARAAGAAG